MKLLAVVAIAMAPLFVSAQAQAPSLPPEVVAALQQQCANGCIVLSNEQAAALEAKINAAIEAARKSCKNI